jgi:DNA helicase-2/ATP-dependent DNA helicase PcrA
MQLTNEQEQIIEAAKTTKDNLLISALAGAAKTSTLCLIAEALKDTTALCLAFNRRIAEEMTRRLPKNCTAQTLNSLGHRAWGETIGRRLILKANKNYLLLRSEIEALPSGPSQDQAWKEMAETLDMISTAKSSGYIPTGRFDQARPLIQDDELFDEVLDPEPSEQQRDLIRNVMIRSIKQAFDGEIDFDDQILMPTVFSALFPRFPQVLVDETQDLSELNIAMLKKIVKQRIIGVGDRLQSIYAFRGAHHLSMDLLQDQFKMTPLELSITFRCPQSVVREAWWRAPNMKWPEWAKAGEVKHWDSWDVHQITEQAAIICRNNAPLFSMAIKFLKAGRNCKIIGANDIGKGLIKIMNKLGQFTTPRAQLLDAIDKWEEEQIKKAKSKDRVKDRADCMRLFAVNGSNLGEAIAYAEHLFKQDGQVQFMTGHKAKGLEFEDVYFLDQHIVKHQEHEQEANLRYVIQTRAKNSLTYINTEGFQ